jgi:hypothetical protein
LIAPTTINEYFSGWSDYQKIGLQHFTHDNSQIIARQRKFLESNITQLQNTVRQWHSSGFSERCLILQLIIQMLNPEYQSTIKITEVFVQLANIALKDPQRDFHPSSCDYLKKVKHFAGATILPSLTPMPVAAA